MDKYYISLCPEKEDTAWYKAIIDVEYFLSVINFKPISIYECINNMENRILPLKDSIIFIQYPRSSFEGLDLIKFTDYIKNNCVNIKTIALVHDLDSMRYGDFFTTNYLTEVSELNQFDYIIAVNDAMALLLKENGITSEIFPLTIFDYFIDEWQMKTKNKITVAYAGNLKYAKSPFIYQLDELDLKNIEIMLYGPYLLDEKFHSKSENVKFMGTFSANELANEINADYGLCWDGDTISTCEGKIGEYLKYTNPHKASLYLSLGLPVIMSADISTASFIQKENVGVIIQNLNDLPEVLNNISNDEYKILKGNAIALSEKLKNGYFIKKVISEIIG